MTEQELFDILEATNLQWGRYPNSDKYDLYVWTPGYKHADCGTLEKHAMSCGYYCMTMDYDSMCGKTIMKFKRKVA